MRAHNRGQLHCLQVAVHGVAMQSDQCGDSPLADPLLVQLLHLIVAVLAPGLPRLLLLLADGERVGSRVCVARGRRDRRIQGFLLLIDVLERVVFALKQAGRRRRHIHQ
jgi:hypothetical protein